MALTFTEKTQGVFGDMRYWLGTVAFDSSYPTGGESVTAAMVAGMAVEVQGVLVDSGSALVAQKRVSWDPSTAKLVIYIEDGTSGKEAEAGSTSDQSGMVDIQLLVLGY